MRRTNKTSWEEREKWFSRIYNTSKPSNVTRRAWNQWAYFPRIHISLFALLLGSVCFIGIILWCTSSWDLPPKTFLLCFYFWKGKSRPSLHKNTWQLLPNLKKTSTFNFILKQFTKVADRNNILVFIVWTMHILFWLLFSFSKYSCSILAWPQITSSLLKVYNSKDHLVSQLMLNNYRLTILTHTTIADDTSLNWHCD